MHVALTISSLVYVLTSLGKTVYGIALEREREEHALVREAVQHVWVSFVKPHKRACTWTAAEQGRARDLAVKYVHRNSSRMCRCCSSSRSRLVSLINDRVRTCKHRGGGGRRCHVVDL